MKTGWILCDKGKTGTYRQCLALADWLSYQYGIQFLHKEIDLRSPWRFLPPQCALWQRHAYGLQKVGAGELAPPYPAIIIAAGRQAVTAAVALRRYSYTSILQNPKISSKYFNLVIPPYHDNLKGKNVLPTQGALHPIRPDQLSELRQTLERKETYKELPFPRVAVLLGGNSKHYEYTAEEIIDLAHKLRFLISEHPRYKGGGLLVTPSRRTPLELLSLFEKEIQGIPHQIWTGQGGNPYMDYLALADALVVTGDSISMMSEACLMGKPVYIKELPIKNKRILSFIQKLYEDNHASPLRTDIKTEGFLPLDELKRLMPLIMESLPPSVKG